MRTFVNVGSCGCCAEAYQYEEVARVLMPDGREIVQAKTLDGLTFWIDPALEVTWRMD